jgi:hypothetical protein
MQLPEHQQPTRSGQPTPGPADRSEVTKLANAVDAVLVQEMQTAIRIDHPDVPSWQEGPRIGSAPPIAQPGRTPMSQGATDASVLMLCGGGATVMVSGSAAGLMYFSQFADPVVCAIVLGAPVALALAIGRLFGRAKAAMEAVPAPVHNHYNGNVHQDLSSTTSKTYGVIANTRNQTR